MYHIRVFSFVLSSVYINNFEFWNKLNLTIKVMVWLGLFSLHEAVLFLVALFF